jgi:hypothetical protein
MKNFEWLNEQYILKQRTSISIANELNCHPTTIQKQLKKYGIPIRNHSDCQIKNKNNDFIFNLDVITGCILGDASLKKEHKNGNARFTKTNKHKEHIEFVANSLFKNSKKHIKPEIRKYKNKKLTYFRINTNRNKQLTELYHDWYPKSVKIIPKNIKITPTVLLHWFLDDGYSYYVNKKYLFVNFCSECFTKKDQLFLCEVINDNFSLNANITKCIWGYGYRIRITSKKVHEFFDIIGKSPIKVFNYKWKN